MSDVDVRPYPRVSHWDYVSDVHLAFHLENHLEIHLQRNCAFFVFLFFLCLLFSMNLPKLPLDWKRSSFFFVFGLESETERLCGGERWCKDEMMMNDCATYL